MKRILFLFCNCVLLTNIILSQNFSPIATTGYTLDAVAENTTALATTNGPLDGSNFALYSAAYGALYSIVGGLPNNGLISSPGYTFQLQPYNQNNVLFTMIGQTDSLIITTPASYASLSLLGFATEGDGTMNITVRFTDNSTQVFTNLSLLDWFNGTSAIISGFGRVSRSSGVITNPVGNPKMFNTNLYMTCANRTKLVQNIKVQNTSGNARICILAVSGSAAPQFTPNSSPVSCANGNNGTASVSIANSLPPNSYTWSTVPVQNAGTAFNLLSGVYNFTIVDGAGCSFTSSVSVGISTVPLAPLQIGTTGTLVCPGTPVSLSTFGASTYTWSNGLNSPITSVTPVVNSSYSVAGTTAANCLVTGSVNISTHSVLPVIFNPIAPGYCVNAPSVALSGNPSGGIYSGTGVSGAAFFPAIAGAGTFVINYTYTDANSCSSSQSISTIVYAMPQVSFSITPNVFCLNSPSLVLNATPSGGTYSGNGIVGSGFQPALHGVGSSSLNYVYTDANNCSNSASVSVTVNGLPTVNISTSITAICVKAANINLQASPSGGQFSGNGVTASVFSPTLAGLGTHVISYTYTDVVTACTNSDTHSITVSACTGLETQGELGQNEIVRVFPNPSDEEVHLMAANNCSFEMYNTIGQIVYKGSLKSEQEYSFSLREFEEGLYHLIFKSSEAHSTELLLIRH